MWAGTPRVACSQLYLPSLQELGPGSAGVCYRHLPIRGSSRPCAADGTCEQQCNSNHREPAGGMQHPLQLSVCLHPARHARCTSLQQSCWQWITVCMLPACRLHPMHHHLCPAVSNHYRHHCRSARMRCPCLLLACWAMTCATSSGSACRRTPARGPLRSSCSSTLSSRRCAHSLQQPPFLF